MRKIIFTLISAVFISSVIIFLKNTYSKDIPIGNRGIRDAVSQGDLDVLFIGSSTFRCDIDMPAMDEAYNGRVYDISYGGNQLVATDIQYDEIKERSENDYGLMVFELGPMMLTEKVALSDSRVIWDLSYKGKKELWEKMESAGTTDFSTRYEYFVSSGLDDLFTYPVTEPFYSTRYYKGAKTDETPSPGLSVLENAEFDISNEVLVPAQEDALKELIGKCKRDGQDFLFLECPHYYRLEEDPVYQRYLEHYISLLDSEEVDYLLASDISFDDHEPEYFEDMNHMSADGRKIYTDMLIEFLRKR
ncbi:MAG: hypothetical protein K5770_03560 [Lachnospiraceae bacterium]|nr:hypothetical protein [Lachnospiraceae bacterium]